MSSLFFLIPVFVLSIGAQVRLAKRDPDPITRAKRKRLLALSYVGLGLLLLLVGIELVEWPMRLFH